MPDRNDRAPGAATSCVLLEGPTARGTSSIWSLGCPTELGPGDAAPNNASARATWRSSRPFATQACGGSRSSRSESEVLTACGAKCLLKSGKTRDIPLPAAVIPHLDRYLSQYLPTEIDDVKLDGHSRRRASPDRGGRGAGEDAPQSPTIEVPAGPRIGPEPGA